MSEKVGVITWINGPVVRARGSRHVSMLELVEVGDLGYWPSGSAFCIFFGPTPVSRGNEVRPASAVNVIGKVSGDAKDFKKVADGAKVRIEKA